jgi:ribonucleoside-diphosphate reductase alpha chain
LPTYVERDVDGVLFFNYDKLHETTKIITKNLNKIIDKNFYPTPKTRLSNLKHRPVGIGIQGLADTFALLRIPFESIAAREVNVKIFETIYHAAIESSMEISKRRHNFVLEARAKGDDVTQSPYNDYLKLNEYEMEVIKTEHPGAYVSFEGSPASKGLLQFDMWGVTPSDRYDWTTLKQEVVMYGIRNSLLVAPMPTASTSQIMGFNESFEPFTSNIFKRKTLGGEFVVINKYLIRDLIERGLWDKRMKDLILLNEGSIQNIEGISEEFKSIYKTAWEIKQRAVIDMSVDRGAYVCQSQSMNIFMEEPDFKKLSSMHFYGWSKGIKTGSYYLRTRPKTKMQQFTIDPNLAKNTEKAAVQLAEPEACLTCSA